MHAVVAKQNANCNGDADAPFVGPVTRDTSAAYCRIVSHIPENGFGRPGFEPVTVLCFYLFGVGRHMHTADIIPREGSHGIHLIRFTFAAHEQRLSPIINNVF